MVEATKESFHDLVSDGVTLVDVWGPACVPCVALMPEVERIEAERSVKVVKVEAPKNRRLCMELKVMGLPAFLLYRDGEEVSRLDGDVSSAGLWEWVEGNLATIPSDGR
jgi:thioredoxin-like negative regulator of GroEL